MVFKPGQSGNPGGRPKEAKLFRDALNLAINRADGDKTKLHRIADALVEKAIAGDVPAINTVADRLDGKAAQTLAIATMPLEDFIDSLDAGQAPEDSESQD